MSRVAAVALLASSLCGCAGAIPVATQLTLGVAAGSLAITAAHDCKSDGGLEGGCLNPLTGSTKAAPAPGTP